MSSSARVLNRGCGSLRAQIMVIGEAPGRLGADSSELPFHGDKAGHNFEFLIHQAGISRSQLFITNAALCNPKDASGNNATPSGSELAACSTFLRRQIDLVQPSLIVTLGASALKALNHISPHNLELRKAVRTSSRWFGRELIPLYHPGQRAMLHRSLANQVSDYNFLAERARRLVKPQAKVSGASRPDIAAVVRIILGYGERSYFSLHKLCYLIELEYAKRNAVRLTSGFYIRQKDGPYCVDLHLQRLKRAGLPLGMSTRSGKLWIALESHGLFTEIASDPIANTAVDCINVVIDRYGRLTDDRLKTVCYLTQPMRRILRKERDGSNQLNAPIDLVDH